ncbi:MAG: hypothetical protein E6J66_05150 [Deltaproteobacteria bacterium]|nr:MAG: hypothetical protein E6J66_05150 [Deltaproteobacteria bacterium]
MGEVTRPPGAAPQKRSAGETPPTAQQKPSGRETPPAAPQKRPTGETPPAAPQKRSSSGAIANGLAATAGGLTRITSRIFGSVASRGGSALADFRARPEHSRWRAYALGSYFLIVAATLAGQLYTDNVLGAYVRVQHVDLPAMTQIFVRNDSGKSWRNVRLTLNGIYQYRTEEVGPGGHVMLTVNKFAIRDQLGKPTYAPRNLEPKTLLVDTLAGRYEAEFRE